MDIKGLTNIEARARLKKYGFNEIKRIKKINPFKIFLDQFTSPFILVLIGAAIVSGLIGFIPGQTPDLIDTILILIIVFISGAAGFIQEYRSEETVEALVKMAAPLAKVLRDGAATKIKAGEIVKGDVILIESGDIVPADAELVEVFNLQVNEASLTGESLPVNRRIGETIFMNTFVNTGFAKARVVRTGMETAMGKVAQKLQTMPDDQSAFRQEMSVFSRNISLIIGSLVLAMAIVNLLKYSPGVAILLAISLAVAAIPEGLPAVLTLTLSLNAKIMAQNKALVRKLSAIESIGSVDIICTDKTGTLTRNEMEVKYIHLRDRSLDMNLVNPASLDAELKLFFVAGALCNNSLIGGTAQNPKYLGDETEIALRKASAQAGIFKEKLEPGYQKVGEISFTSKRKMMTVIYHQSKKAQLEIFSKGAPEVLIEHCSSVYNNGKLIKLKPEDKEKILKQNKEFAKNGLRVLGLAVRKTKAVAEKDFNSLENNLVWLGLEAMHDPPRQEVTESLAQARSAGIRVIMITGDNILTAQAIAREVGLRSAGALAGHELEQLSDSELEMKLAADINIFARTTPEHKLRLLEVLKKHYRVAMTGDGVNDSLALKKADVGVAMGIKGTEVAKEASDIILLDDNFATITNAIKEGRKTFDNIRKFVNYLLTCNLAEIFVIFIATIFVDISGPVLFPAQILWINLLTDGLPALALGVDPARPDVMKEAPRGKNKLILSRRLRWLIGSIGLKKAAILLAIFVGTLPLGLDVARSTLLTGFVFYEFVRVGSIRSQEKLGWFSNKWLIVALLASSAAQLFILYTPLNAFFGLVPLGWQSWLIMGTGIALGYLIAIWITKLVFKLIPE
ncbi:MAG: cation-transporting P-type ATPase [Patescibacteria group bacterium]|jgi:Ca2+-transporting ATPase|nr:cation-transporting P-type ATPase [Patescibacteria group bacterium]